MPARWMILIKNKEWGRKMDWEGMEGRGKEKKRGKLRRLVSRWWQIFSLTVESRTMAGWWKRDHPLNYYWHCEKRRYGGPTGKTFPQERKIGDRKEVGCWHACLGEISTATASFSHPLLYKYLLWRLIAVPISTAPRHPLAWKYVLPRMKRSRMKLA